MVSKYIMLNNSKSLLMSVPIVFPEHIEHVYIANKFGGKKNISSAGFIKVTVKDEEIEVTCWGESKSLKMKSAGAEDAKFIKLMLRD
jgi:hypothetical protein